MVGPRGRIGTWREQIRRLLAPVGPLVQGAHLLLRLLPSVSPPATLALALSIFVLAGAPVGLAVVTGNLVARLPEDLRAGHVTKASVVLLLAVPAVSAAGEAARRVAEVLGTWLGRCVDGLLRERALAASLEPVGISHLEDPELREVFGAARNVSLGQMMPGDAVQYLAPAIVPRLQAVIIVTILAMYQPLVACWTIICWGLSQIITIGVAGRLRGAGFVFSPDVVYLRELALSEPPAKEVRVFGLGPWLLGRFTQITQRRLDEVQAGRRGQVPYTALGGAALGLGLVVSVAWVASAAAAGRLSVADTTVLVMLLTLLLGLPGGIGDIMIAYAASAIMAVERVRTSSEKVDPVAERAATPSGPRHGIELRGLTFAYPGRAAAVLDGIDLVIPAGQRLAIVGLNGAGKTTLVKLLCRMYDPDQGDVLVDGVSLRDLDPVGWRRRLGVLFQDFIRWSLPARDNVTLSMPGTPVDDEAIERAAQVAGASSLVSSLPAAWDTPLSTGRTGGVDLSGGQWQRVALTRAVYAVQRGARLLILDEPTANLDPRAEQAFFEDFLTNPGLRATEDGAPITSLLISHRFATVRKADRIVVLSQGRIVEDGTHESLLAAGGQYADLFEAQARPFRDDTDVSSGMQQVTP